MMQTLPEQLGMRILIQLAQIIGSKNEPPKTANVGSDATWVNQKVIEYKNISSHLL
jgi:hypothetical protein